MIGEVEVVGAVGVEVVERAVGEGMTINCWSAGLVVLAAR